MIINSMNKILIQLKSQKKRKSLNHLHYKILF